MSDADQLYREHEQLKTAGDYDGAIGKLFEILRHDDHHVMSHLALAVLLGKQGKHEDAVRHGQRACEIDPHDPFNFTALSVTFQRAFAGTQNHAYIQMAEDAMARSHMLHGR